MEDKLKNIFVNSVRYCKPCVDCPEYRQGKFNNVSVSDMITEGGMLIPTPSVRFANLHPNLTRHQDSLTSTDRRINQGADQIYEAQKERISETKDSQMKTLNLIPEFRDEEQVRELPKKPKAYLSRYSDKSGSSPFYCGKSVITTTSDSYRNVMQAANLINYEKGPHSTSRSDFKPKVLYPFSTSSTESYSMEPQNEQWMKYHKGVSSFCDVEVSKKYGYYKFADDENPTF